MSVSFRKDRNRWEVVVYVNGKRVRGHFEKKKDALEFELELKSKKMEFVGIPQSPTIKDAFQEFLATTSSFKSKRSKQADERFFIIARHFFEKERGLRTVEQIKVVDLELFILWLAPAQQIGNFSKPSWSGTTVAKCVKRVKAVIRKLYAHERIKRNVSDALKVPRGTPKRRRAMTAEEFHALFEAAPKWYKPILLFMRLTGARPSSVAYLRWSDVNFSTAAVYLSSKKGGVDNLKKINIPMYDDLWNLMGLIKNESPHVRASDAVFLDRRGIGVSASVISTTGSRLIKECGLDGVVLYGLRHALAVDMVRAGVNLEVIRQSLGHSSIDQTSDYAQSIESDLVKNAFRLIRGKGN